MAFSAGTGAPLKHSSATDKGLCRGNNEDSFLSSPEHGLWLVADGMGGHEAGEVASAIVKDTVARSVGSGQALGEAIQQSHHEVLEAANNGRGAAGMGSTVVALHSDALNYEVAWVGDSRAYLWTLEADGGRLEQLTTDHSYVQMLLATGAIAEDEVDNHPDKNVITQCIGSIDLPQVNVDSVFGKWEERQWLLLCSDGLTDEVDDQTIARTLCDAKSSRDAVQRLVQVALSRGGRDNVTVQIVESPFSKPLPLAALWDWLPAITGKRLWDGALYGAACLSLLLMLYWLVA
ncbi:serine/threonine-protein phosphatase [Exilibacterium tricleocarpae]|uniref:Serine/threonine-protein phosphatase n=1 Tax=Exilibacterium tricleocarpae TaxID=2591008 RepID=A0A545TUS9_9GAMM|nr:protein phosphatase 2C domain-containing protein [Exilibacterium tricleocarpae]TQV80985.1 serine/threonine-protein phosphatase [Exilibacterium tricleocarpae]